MHLDVKPRNVVMGGSPRLIDLSVAMRLDQVADIRRPVGTDAYMAPEQCDPERFATIGPPADVWGLGATIHETLTGAQPSRAPPASASRSCTPCRARCPARCRPSWRPPSWRASSRGRRTAPPRAGSPTSSSRSPARCRRPAWAASGLVGRR